MNKKFYQACFSHVDTDDLSAGWQIINTSPDIMQSMVAFYETNEKINDVSVTKQNADGSHLTVTKIICDTKNIGLVKIQYGFTDKGGRACFFSHGYIANDPYEVLKNPESILNISDDNFRFSVEETQNIPDELSYIQPLSEKDIIDKYGLNRESCVKFIKCVLFPLFSSAQTTVFIKTDGSREMAMDLLYIIYHSLPYSLRPRVTASTYAKPTGANSMYVFTDDIPDVGNHVNPISGDNNILSEAYEKRLERFPFATHYVEHMPQPIEVHNEYYNTFEEVLKDMGDIHINKMESLRLAFTTFTSTKTADNEIGGLLYDWLALSVPANENVVARIEKFVRVATVKGIDLSENVIKLLQDRIKESNSDVLYKSYVNYEACSLIKVGNEAFKKMDVHTFKKMDVHRRDKVFYHDLCTVFRQTPDGEALLNAYYLNGAQQLVDLRTCSYNDMISFIAECNYIIDIQKVRNIFSEKCKHILLAEQRKGKNFKAIYSAYQKTVKEIDPNAKISWKEFTDEYDGTFKAHFDETRITEYEEFYRIFNTQYPWSTDFLKVRKAVESRKFNVATEYIQNNCCLGYYQISSEDVQAFSKNILEYAFENDAAELCTDMAFWYAFATVLNYDLIDLMVKKHVSVLCNPDVLSSVMDSDRFWCNLENLEYIYEGCLRYYDDHKDQQAITKYTLRLLKDQISAVKKAQKAEEKKHRSTENSNDSNPLLNVFQNLRNIGKRSEYDEQKYGSLYEEKPQKLQKEKQSNLNKKKHK